MQERAVLILPPIGRALEDNEWMALVSLFGAAPDEYLFHVWLSGPPGGVPDSWHAETLDPVSGDATEATVPFSPSERSPVRTDRYHWEMLGILKDWPAPDEPGYTRPPWPAIRTFASAGKIGPAIKIGGAIATCQVRLYCGWFESSAITAEMSWSGEPSPRWAVRGLSHPPKSSEWIEARRVLRILQQDPAGGGRPRMEAAPESDTLELARQAKDLLDKGRYSRLTNIADYLGMVTTDEDLIGENPAEHRKAIRAAAERLKRGIKRLEEIGEA
jgi:hypothetical protein